MGEYKLAIQRKEYEATVQQCTDKMNENIQENMQLKELINDKDRELARRKGAQGGASRIHQLEEKIKKLEAENMALECEMGELLEIMSNGDTEEEANEEDEEPEYAENSD